MSLLKAWRSVTSVNGSPEPRKRARFSLFTSSRSSPTPRPGTALDVALAGVSPDDFWSRPSQEDYDESRIGEDGNITLERSFTLSVLEGRRIIKREARGSTGTSNTYVSGGGELSQTPSLKASPPPLPPKSRARSASVSSSRSESADGRRRKPSLKPHTLGLPELEEARPDESRSGLERKSDADRGHPPTYSSAAYPTHAVTYRFAQAGPFAMTLEAEGKETGLNLWRYHIEVGMNVLTLRSWITTVRRGGEDGLLVAEIESGLSAGNATITMGGGSRSSRAVLSRTLGSRMYYIGDGTAIRWNLGETKWEAYFDTVELATFDIKSPRRLVMQPMAHRFFDHVVVAILILMREKEDASGSRADAGTLPPSPLG